MSSGKNFDASKVQVELDRDDFDLLLKHCDSNIVIGLAALQNNIEEGHARQLVELIERFKKLKKTLIAADPILQASANDSPKDTA